ncbi:hypothetical protein MNBD_GAMMA10-2655 [hydrothermal vent metagenome]|uniref:Uncharacterized protein n=1 Tax=hydrothermal vent metagenome TaxID=652676 RepID=A0A3B0XW21_9ZZZZ
MTEIKNRLIAIMCLMLFATTPAVVFSDNSGAGFVRPALMNLNTAGKVASDHLEHWQKHQWRSGYDFNTHERFRFMTTSSSAADSQAYTRTEPQRKSVNPWKVNAFNNNRYTSRPVKRPWGRVPDQYNKKTSSGNVPDQYSVAAGRAYRNTAQHPPFREQEPMLAPMFRPYINNHLLNGSSFMSPFNGYLPVYSNQMLINKPAFFYQGYAYPGNYLWR